MLIVVRLEGGLGNQLFQVSYAVAVQEAYGGRIILDTRLIDKMPGFKNPLYQIVALPVAGSGDKLITALLRIWAGIAIRFVRRFSGSNLKASQLLAKIGIHHPFDTIYQDFDGTRMPFVYIHGNFMSEKYFAKARESVRALIDPAKPLNGKCFNLYEKIKSEQSVAVHVRRGDYLSCQWREKLHICDRDYYFQAISKIIDNVSNPIFYIFTNNSQDANWIRHNYTFFPENTIYISNDFADVEHFALMAACKHFIISNSTFSWWASYLSVNDEKIIVAPNSWNRNAWDMRDIYMPEWLLVGLDVERKD